MSLIDLSHEIADGLVTYPGIPGPVVDEHLSFDASHGHYAAGTEFSIGRIQLVANTGTYLDTPAHRYRDGADLADLSLDAVTGLPGVVLDAQSPVEPGDLDGMELSGRAVLVRTGWDVYWRSERYADGGQPFVSGGAAQRLVESGAALVGIDGPNIDDIRPETAGERPAHTALLAAGIPIVEHLTGLDALGDVPFTFTAVPVKVRGMASFPVRAFADVDATR